MCHCEQDQLVDLSSHLLIIQSHFYFNHLKLQLHLFCQSFYGVLLEKLWPLNRASCLIDAHNHTALLRKVTLVLKRQSGIIPWAKLCKCSIFMRPQPARESSRKGSTEASVHSSPSQPYASSCPPSPACSLPHLSFSCIPFLPSATALHSPHLLLPLQRHPCSQSLAPGCIYCCCLSIGSSDLLLTFLFLFLFF